jgi:FKBP-type peptidyl-prolyl cis-trans isomerase
MITSLCASLALVLPLVLQAPQNPPIPADTEITTTASGLKMSTLAPGDGKTQPKVGDVVKMNYTGWLTDGTVFDSSVTRKEAFYFELGKGRVIKGWDEGVATMTKGQKLKLTIPPQLAYGEQAQGKIPANSTLIFEVELIDVAWSFAPLDASTKKTAANGMGYSVIRPGTGQMAKDGDAVKFTYAVWKPDGEMIEYLEAILMQRGRAPSQMFTGGLGKLPGALNDFLRFVPLGGATRFEAPAGLCWPQRLPQGLKPDTLVTWQVELHGITPVPQFSMPEESKLKRTASGLAYEVIKEGTGKQPKASDRVTVHYSGWTTDGKNFDSSYSRGQTTSFGLGQVIKGWTEGLQLMKEGAAYKFVIPPELGYGAQGAGADIPPNATLVFYVELVSVP